MPRRLFSFDRLFVLLVGVAIAAVAAHNVLKERRELREHYAERDAGHGWLSRHGTCMSSCEAKESRRCTPSFPDR